MKFVNRKGELERLKKLQKSSNSGLAVIWGRRRVGKTRLLLEWTDLYDGVYFVADESASPIQRKFFSIALESALPGFSAVEYPDWQSLFSRLCSEAILRKWRGPLVIDEFPYLVSNAPELPSIMQQVVDHAAKKAKLLIALSGSSQRMMQGAILQESAPLYGRADEIIKLSPIAIGYMKQALQLKTPREVVETYAIWGGIPRYWELTERAGGNLLANIDRLVLDPMGPLNEEPQRLLREESPSALHLKSILDAIGLGANRLGEIASRMGEPITSLSRQLDRLRELDLIIREVPYGTDFENSKRSLYKIKDPFLRFWFQIVAPRRSLFSQLPSEMRCSLLKEGLPRIFSATWEELCRLAIPVLSQKWGIPFEPTGRYWQGQGPEWDVLSQSFDGMHFLIGEAKWTEKKVSIPWIYNTLQKLKANGVPPVKRHPNAQYHYILFIPEKPAGLRLPHDVRIVTAKDVIAVLT